VDVSPIRASSALRISIPSIDILSVEEARMGETSTELRTSYEKSSHLLLFIQPIYIYIYIYLL